MLYTSPICKEHFDGLYSDLLDYGYSGYLLVALLVPKTAPILFSNNLPLSKAGNHTPSKNSKNVRDDSIYLSSIRKSAIPPATETLSDSFIPFIGISTMSVTTSRIFCGIPSTSLPRIKAVYG